MGIFKIFNNKTKTKKMTNNNNNPHLVVNRKIKITRNAHGHGFRVGEVVVVAAPIGVAHAMYGQAYSCRNAAGLMYNVYSDEFIFYKETRREISKELKAVRSKETALQLKLEYLRETDSNEMDLDEFREFMVKKVIASDDTIIQKTKKINALYGC